MMAAFIEHGHHHALADYARLDVSAPGYQDPHELADANDIRRRFAGRSVTTGQIVISASALASRRWSGFGEFARKAPYLSGVMIALVGLYVGYQGLIALA